MTTQKNFLPKNKRVNTATEKYKKQEALIDEASRESFPASDPPAFMPAKRK